MVVCDILLLYIANYIKKIFMFDFDKSKEKAKELYHLSWLMKDYMKYICDDICTDEEERVAIIINYIANLSDKLYFDFLNDESEI